METVARLSLTPRKGRGGGQEDETQKPTGEPLGERVCARARARACACVRGNIPGAKEEMQTDVLVPAANAAAATAAPRTRQVRAPVVGPPPYEGDALDGAREWRVIATRDAHG